MGHGVFNDFVRRGTAQTAGRAPSAAEVDA